jgi:hypothetical protein
MRSKLGSAIIAGLVGGLVFGVGMQMMSAPTPDGGSMPMINMVGKIVGQPNAVGGWLYHLFNSAVIGAIFGLLFGNRVVSGRSGLGYGILYGIGWWILGGLILMPALLGMPAFAPLMMPMMQPVAWGSLAGHIMYGALTGLVFNWLYKPGFVQAAKEMGLRVGIP